MGRVAKYDDRAVLVGEKAVQNAFEKYTPQTTIIYRTYAGGYVALALIVIVNVLVFSWMTDTFNATEFTATQIAYVGGTYGPYLDKGEYWRLLTASYIHLNLPHIAFNMLALLVWGRKVSQRLGFIRFIVFYTICGILGSLVSVTYQPEVVAAGASGAISGVLAELFVLRFAGDPTIEAQGLVGVFIYNAVYSVAMPNIDWRGHAGGFVAGLIVGYALLLTVPRKRAPLVAAATAEAPFA